MKNFLIIDFDKNTCEVESADFNCTHVQLKNIKRNKNQKELLNTIKEFLERMKED